MNINMVVIIKKRCGKNSVEKIADNGRILWFTEKQIEEGLDYKNLHTTTAKCLADYREHEYEQGMSQGNNSTEFLQTKNQQSKEPWIVEYQQHINLEQDQISNCMMSS